MKNKVKAQIRSGLLILFFLFLAACGGGLARLPHDVSIRYGLVIYRDRAKNESVQLFSLTDDWTLFVRNLMMITAVGGGDYPENLYDGLSQTVESMNWNPEAAHLLILLGDAPPHVNREGPAWFAKTMQAAVEQNIASYTVGSDGLNETGIELFKQIAEAGNGRFLFVSNSLEDTQMNGLTVQPIISLIDILLEIVFEVLNEEAP